MAVLAQRSAVKRRIVFIAQCSTAQRQPTHVNESPMNSMRRPLRMPGVGGGGRKAPAGPSSMLCSQATPFFESVSLVMVRVCCPAVQAFIMVDTRPGERRGFQVAAIARGHALRCAHQAQLRAPLQGRGVQQTAAGSPGARPCRRHVSTGLFTVSSATSTAVPSRSNCGDKRYKQYTHSTASTVSSMPVRQRG